MSNNTYFYLSSLGSNDNAVFECTLPEPVTIAPFSEVRCVSCRINPSDNLMEVDNTNDLFYVGVDNWAKVNSCIPLLPVKLTKGLYDMVSGDDDFLNLTGEIKEKLEEALEPYCLLRGGSTVSINDNRKLKIKLSTMGVYKCPTAALTADVLAEWVNNDDNRLRHTLNNVIYSPIAQFTTAALPTQYGGNTYYGIGLGKVDGIPQYHIGPPIVTGMTGTTDQAKHISHVIECDFRQLVRLGAELGATHTTADDYIRIYFGNARPDTFGQTWGHEPKMSRNNDPVADLRDEFLYVIEFSNVKVNVRTNELYQGRVQTRRRSVHAGGNNYSITSQFQIICEEWEDEHYSNYGLVVKRDDGQGGGYVNMANLTFNVQKTIDRQKSSNTPNRLAAVIRTDYANMDNMIRYTAAVDSDTAGWDADAVAYQEHTSNSADISNRLLSVFSNNVGGDNTISERVMRTMRNAMTDANLTDNADVINNSYTIPAPNADILSWDSNQDDGLVTSASSYTSGIQGEGGVSANNRDFPCFYLSVPSLPIKNYTGNRNEGFEQTFICPIELSQSQTSQRLYTSKQYTENYVSLTNSYPMDISSLKVRITDINNVPTKQLQKYTIIVLEVRESPYYKNEQLLNTLKSLADRNVDPFKLIGNQ